MTRHSANHGVAWIAWIGAALAVLSLPGCGSGLKREAAGAVRAYNAALVEAYRHSDPKRLEPAATAEELRKVWALIDLKRGAGLVLECTLESMEVTSAATAADGALIVETRERWRYFDRALNPGTSPGTVFVADMRIRYRFLREGDAWKMDRGETLACEYLEPKGFDPRSTAHPAGPVAGES